MDPFTRVELNELMAVSAEPALSIYVPTTEDQPQHYDHGRIRLKNLLGQARERLAHSRRWRDLDQDALLAEAETLLLASQFWAQQSDGLALFITPEATRYWRLPVTVEPTVYLSDAFHIRPVLPFILDDEPFFILALSRNNVRLLEAGRHDVAERALPDTPTSLEEAMQWDDPEKQLRARSAKGVQGVPAFHGHSPKDDEVTNLIRFVQQIDDGVARAIGSEDALLVLAGTDTLTASYRQTATRGHLLQQELDGNPDNRSARALRDAAWPLVHAWRTTQRSAIADRYGARQSAGRATAEFEQVVRAAHFGQIEVLFLPHSVDPVFGRYLADGAQVEITDQPEDGDLLNMAAIETLRNGGAVYTDMTPLADRAAALLRYSVDTLPA